MFKKKTNPLATYIYDNIGAFSEEMKHKIAKWHVMIASNHIEIETFDKRKISIKGSDYSGTLVSLYWSFFDPFIKNYISITSEELRQKAIDTNIDAEQSLKIFRDNFRNTIENIYKKISETDRLMRGKGYPKNVSLKPVDSEINHMIYILDEKINAQIDIAKKQKLNKRKEFLLAHLNWLMFILIIFLCWICEKMKWNNLGTWLNKIYEKL